MFTYKQYRNLDPLVNNHDAYRALQEYKNIRIESLRDELERCRDECKSEYIRGAIAELRLFQNLRDNALAGANVKD